MSRVKCGVWGMGCMECEGKVSSVECKVVKCGVYSGKVWSVKCKIVECKV